MVILLQPQPGQPLQGVIHVTANITVPDIESVELSFAYAGDTTQTWFLIAELTLPLEGEKLAEWDTTTITDGNYVLRLVVVTRNGRRFTTTVSGLRVRNYSPIETPTPTASATLAPEDIPVPTFTPTLTATPVPPTATPLPPNPAQVTTGDIANSLGRGALGVVAFFALIGVYVSVRKMFSR